MNSTVVYLPFSTAVAVRAVTNASFTQQVVLDPETGKQITWSGSGEADHQIGSTILTTPGSGRSPRGFMVTVTVNTEIQGKWAPSSVAQGNCGVMYYQATLVVSEDYVDQDWNDSVVFFTWWVPPSLRRVEDFALTPKSAG